MTKFKVLFITKQNETYGFQNFNRKTSGLYNSTRFIVEGLRNRGIEAEIVEVIDNNCIDRVVTEFKPNIVVIEALWVVPDKFDTLKRLHPSVKWMVHLHSQIPFLALEGIAVDWISSYARKKIGLIANSKESFDAISTFLDETSEIIYLPNVYIGRPWVPYLKHHKHYIDIGCFGAIRPLKNQLLQAMAAIQFAKELDKPLRFHINATRVETGGDPVLKNLRALFSNPNTNGRLVESKWNEPEELISYLHAKIDIGMQVSLTETFNVVSADYVTAGIPIVVSKEVRWASWFSQVSDDSIDGMVVGMWMAYRRAWLVRWNQHLLSKHSHKAQGEWFDFVTSSRSFK